ncbi:hypothetical protein HPB48_017938 [Haemaphysalis longicornis]|uniref:Uncharacterized protein n=1 Tax=Haemaphysalis longicornis TaxID=44386 RepID=A0A9J6H594_HAELO|nr:hypothetical protein HPB48_017938 [Haemaphysalis longicornis]
MPQRPAARPSPRQRPKTWRTWPDCKWRNDSDAAAQSSWVSRVTGFAERELFFIGSCFKWCAAVADDVVPGSLGFTPARLRCNVPVALTDGFGQTFGCKKEHRMSQIAANYSCNAPGDVILPVTLDDSANSTTTETTGHT